MHDDNHLLNTRYIPCVCEPHIPASSFGRDGKALEVINSMISTQSRNHGRRGRRTDARKDEVED